jgi:hypothetical protein
MNALARVGVTALATLGLALGAPATAHAERILDVEAYDNCMAQIPTLPINYDYDHWKCCKDAGGDYEHGDGAGDMGRCKAPPAEAESVPGNTNPTVTGKPRPPLVPGTSVG